MVRFAARACPFLDVVENVLPQWGIDMSRLQRPEKVRYPLIECAGSARELGRQHGEQAGLRIRAFLGFLCETLQLDDRDVERRARRFRPLFEKHCSHLIPEIEGLAEGAGISFELALAAQLRGELGQLSEGACTTFVIGPRGTADGHTLIGQTSDMPAEMRSFGYVLHLKPSDRPELIMWTFGGQLGYHGLNEFGVAHFANALGGGPKWKFAPSHYPLKRLLLEQNSLAGVRRSMSDFPVCSNGNYVVSDGSGGILDVELTSDGPHFLEDDGSGFIAHSNHFLCSAHACEDNFNVSLPDSFPRLKRMRELLAAEFGSLTVETLQRILSDHDGYPVSICRHPHGGPSDPILPNTGHTVAAIIAEPQSGRFHIASGNPCETPFIEFQLDAFLK